MSIENGLLYTTGGQHVMKIDVSDLSRVHLFCKHDTQGFVEGPSKVRVLLLTSFSTVHAIYSKHNIDRVITTAGWYPYSGHMDAISPGTTIRVYKYI